MRDVLLAHGSIIKAYSPRDDEKIETYIVIGVRQVNPNTMNRWDYVCAPFSEGYRLDYSRYRKDWESNIIYFNHTDIEEIVLKAEHYKEDDVISENLGG